jgi:hypothetical protein
MTAADATYARRWLMLAVVGVAQVMVVLDATVVSIALPTAQRALQFSKCRPPMGHHRVRAGVWELAPARQADR